MKLIDRILLAPALFFLIYVSVEERFDSLYASYLISGAASVSLLILFDRMNNCNVLIRSRKHKALLRRAAQYVLSLASIDPDTASEHIRKAICSYYQLQFLYSDPNGFLAFSSKSGKRIFISICLKHPDDGALSARDAAEAIICKNKYNADCCAVACLGDARKFSADTKLAQVRIFTGNDLAKIFAANPELIADEAIEHKKGTRRSIISALRIPPDPKRIRSHILNALLLFPGWLISGNFVLLLCILFHLSYAILGIVTGKHSVLPDI